MTPLPALALLRRFWWAVPLLALALWAWRVDSLRARHLSDLRACTALRQSDAANWKAAYQASVTIAETAKQQKEAEYAKAATTADANYAALRARYADSLRAAQANSRGTGSTDMPRPAEAAGVPSDPAPVTVGHPDKLADLSAYADECQSWALEVAQ